MFDSYTDKNGKVYRIVRLLGKGKGGYSYLVNDEGGNSYVLKKIHHEPCDYYTFGDKLGAELYDYKRLSEVGIKIPVLLNFDRENELLIKEYICGDTVFDMVVRGEVPQECFDQVRKMSELLIAAGLNIDYFPTNFILQNGELYYIDFECNEYMPQWNFENWGIKYWSRTDELEEYLRAHSKENGVQQ